MTPGVFWACPSCIRRGPTDVPLWRIPHCTECGARMVQVECPICQKPLSLVTRKFCTNCGTEVEDLCRKFEPLLRPPRPAETLLIPAPSEPAAGTVKGIDDVIPKSPPEPEPEPETDAPETLEELFYTGADQREV